MAVTDNDRAKFAELSDEFGSEISEVRRLQDNEIDDALIIPGTKGVGEDGQYEFVSVTFGQMKGAAGGVQIVNNLVDGGTTKALSAEMGKTLKGLIDQGGGGGQGTVKGAKVGSGSTISPDSNGIVTLPNYAENATKVESSSTNGSIKINGTETKVFEMPSSDPYTTARTPSSHSHGNIANGGTLSDTAADAAGNDLLVIRDADNNKIQTSTIKGTDVADAVSKKHSHSNKNVLDSITQEKMESWDNASSGGVTNVSYNGTTKAITKTVGGQTTEVVSASTLKADMGLTKSDIGLGNVTNDAQVKRSEMGANSGVATLGSDGKLPTTQLPVMKTINNESILGSGNITIQGGGATADEEDLTNASGVLKLKNRTASTGRKGMVILRQGTALSAQMVYVDTIYVIRYAFDISGETNSTLTVPQNCVLRFEGGSISGGTLTGNNTIIDADAIQIFSSNTTLSGTWNVSEAYPEWFGAKGDGITDDTESIRVALHNINNTNIPLVFDNHKKYIISDALNYYNDSYFNINAVLYGQEYREFDNDNFGILLNSKNGAVFKNAERIMGVMKGMRFVCLTDSHTTDNTSVFYNCGNIRRFTFECCFVAFFNCFAAGTKFKSITRIQQSRIKVFEFSKPIVVNGETVDSWLVDTSIEDNYITGTPDAASEYQNVNNTCFRFTTYNGSYIRNNFIDYYMTIFDAGIDNGYGNIDSIGNQYQVFRYFYRNLKPVNNTVSYISLTSVGDAFNWTNPEATEPIIERFENFAETYVGQDGETYKVPPYILRVSDYISVSITNCILENNLGNVVFIEEPIVDPRTKIVFTCNETASFLLPDSDSIIPVARLEGTIGNDGRAYNVNNIPNYMALTLDRHTMPTVSELPTTQWTTRNVNGVPVLGQFSKYLFGEKVRLYVKTPGGTLIENRVYTFEKLVRDNTTVYRWTPEYVLPKELTTATRSYRKVGSDGVLSMEYSLCYIGYGSATVDNNTVIYDTISSFSIPESLFYIPLVIYNYDDKDIIITAASYNGENAVLKPYQCCIFVAYGTNSVKILCVSTPAANIHKGTFQQAQALVSQNKITASDAGYEFYLSSQHKPIYYGGDNKWYDSSGNEVTS